MVIGVFTCVVAVEQSDRMFRFLAHKKRNDFDTGMPQSSVIVVHRLCESPVLYNLGPLDDHARSEMIHANWSNNERKRFESAQG
jgi:hypothetical protein